MLLCIRCAALAIYTGIQMKPIDGFGNVVGYGTPKYTRVGASADHYGNTGIAISAVMEFDTADAQDLVDRGLFGDLILHEMAHALGFGKLAHIMIMMMQFCLHNRLVLTNVSLVNHLCSSPYSDTTTITIVHNSSLNAVRAVTQAHIDTCILCTVLA
jgi:hypothetical protein